LASFVGFLRVTRWGNASRPQNDIPLSPVTEVSMQLTSAGTLRTASFTAITIAAVTLWSSACRDGASTAPVDARAVDVSAPALASIPTDPILDIVAAVTAAWTAKDAAAYAAPYAVDIQIVSPVGSLLVGREAVRAQHAFLFSGPFAGSTQTIEVRDIQFLTGTIAIVYQDVSLTGYAFLPPGLPSSGGVVRTRVTWVVEKRGGSWEIVFQQMTPRL
jgi:uncharacterized protein (TIGR02246 family)